MANLRTAMDAAFWDLDIASPQTFDGVARSIPEETVPLDGTRASRVDRIQQLRVLRKGFPLRMVPAYSPPSQKELGALSLQSALFLRATNNWWLGLIGQIRPQKLVSAIKAEIRKSDWKLPPLENATNVARHFLDESLYAIGLCSELALTSSTSLRLSIEKHGENKKRRSKAILLHKLPEHEVTLEAAWPELFVDHNGKYWDVPESVSLDCSSLAISGLRYRFGIHKNGGRPLAVDSVNGDAPLSLMPGICTKAAFSYEISKDFWRVEKYMEEDLRETAYGTIWEPGYDFRLSEPHAAISGIIGGTCGAWFGGRENSTKSAGNGNIISMGGKRRSPFSADIFGSVCYTLQHGKYKDVFGDLTRVDARLDIASASASALALAKGVSKIFRNSSVNNGENLLASPRLSLIFQQQVVGPILFRLDSRFTLGSSGQKRGPHMEDIVYSLNYGLKSLRSGKVVAWYSPKRKEGMIELRVFEF